jgi:DNA-binding transcriptional ArsR family regulator
MKAISDINDPRLVKALAHPLRLRILGILENRVASPSELAEELSAPLGNVSYHVRMLADFGLIKLVRRTPRRGAVEHHYEAVSRVTISDDAWSQLPGLVKEALVGETLAQVGEHVNSAAAGGGFDGPDVQVSRLPLLLDRRGMKELSRELTGLLTRAQAIQRDSAKRIQASGRDEELEAGMVLMLFEGADVSNEHRVRGKAAAAATNGSARRTPRLERARAR